jgi:hypothetical protein
MGPVITNWLEQPQEDDSAVVKVAVQRDLLA